MLHGIVARKQPNRTAARGGPHRESHPGQGFRSGCRRPPHRVAVSDELGLTAQPVLTLVRKNRRQDLGSLARLVRKYGCAQVVVGNPLYMSGDISPQALKAQAVAQSLQQETGVTVTLWDERLSTTEAHRHLDAAGRLPADRRAVIDQVAAVLILQSFLDSRR